MNVIMDKESFPAEKRETFQRCADRIVREVNLLIPGTSQDFPESGIICFESSPIFQATCEHSGPTVLAGPKLEGEPIATRANTIRIAVSGFRSFYMRKFVFQLSHELAHVKMGPRIDGSARINNALIETFAVAVSHEVLRRLDLYDYLIPEIQTQIRLLPKEIQNQLASGDMDSLREYWQSCMSSEWDVVDDRTMQTLGSLLLKMGNEPRWELLFDIAAISLCPDGPYDFPVMHYPPDIPRITKTGLSLKSLGY